MCYLSQTKSIRQKKANILLTLCQNKSMETTTTEKVFETGGMKPVSGEHTNAAKPEMSEDQFYTYVSQNTGLEIKSEDDLKKVLLEYKKYKDDPYGGVSNF